MTPQVSRVFPTSLLQPRVGSISVDPTTELKSNRSFPNLQVIFSRQERTEFISITTRVLYITEYLVLVEYTEAVLPMVYERELLNKEVLAIRQARLQKYYETCYQEWEQELRARGLALVRDRD
ncbi:hypothetical protein PR002_g9049 [Phytophthora rubi]|uniref:Uncharacterized protein n=1 Tax=Phytophthora rubi TaxID=129364 RepID=A0A6A3MU34_9STRA|nr:hypothetical protein PR002_g9049 [Phytophthora rubi]